MSYTDDEIREPLSIEGVSLDDYFLLSDGIMFLLPLEGGASVHALVIEDDGLWEACKAFLLARGARQFSSWSAFEAWQREHDD